MHVGHKHFLPQLNISSGIRTKQKKPINLEEIAPVKGRFAEDEQQEGRRRPPQNPSKSVRPLDEADVMEAERAFGKPLSPLSSSVVGSTAAMLSIHTLSPPVPSAQAMAQFDALLSGIISERAAIDPASIAHREASAEPSLGDLLALMRGTPQKS